MQKKGVFIGIAAFAAVVLALGLGLKYGVDWDDDDASSDDERRAPPADFEHLVPVEGTQNLRDLGEYETSDGKWVKTGVIYRSDSLENVMNTEEIRRLNLVTIVDLRSEDEIHEGPNKLPEPNEYRLVNYPIGNPEDLAELLPAEVLNGTTPEEVRAELTDLYLAGEWDQMDAVLASWNVDLAEERRKRYVDFFSIHSDVFAKLFEEILMANGQPLLFHCHGGKDRTGAGAALILLLWAFQKRPWWKTTSRRTSTRMSRKLASRLHPRCIL